MFTEKELLLMKKPYFEVLRKLDDFVEIKSCYTGHCWIIHRHKHQDDYPIWLYHTNRKNHTTIIIGRHIR